MKTMKIPFFAVLLLTVLSFGCAKDTPTANPALECSNRRLVPPNVEVKGEKVSMALESLAVSVTTDPSNSEIIEVPSLKGKLKIVNTSKDLVEVHGVTVEYMDRAGSPIIFQSGEKHSKVALTLTSLLPGESYEGSLHVTFPRNGVKELDQINVNIIYIASPLGQETLTMRERVE